MVRRWCACRYSSYRSRLAGVQRSLRQVWVNARASCPHGCISPKQATGEYRVSYAHGEKTVIQGAVRSKRLE